MPVTILDPADLLRAEADENVVRKDFTPSEAVAIFQAMGPDIRAEAKARMSAVREELESPRRDGEKRETSRRLQIAPTRASGDSPSSAPRC